MALWFTLTDGRSVSSRSYILRITKEEWYKQVFKLKKYYPGVPRRWEPGLTILLARKADKGDSFVGYGIVEKFVERSMLSKERRQECERMRWKGELVFSKLFKLEPPVPIKETILGGSAVRGRCLHGYPLSGTQVESILEKAREMSVFTKID